MMTWWEKPETEVKEELTEWLTQRTGVTVYWEKGALSKSPEYDYPPFQTSGKTDQPDLFVRTPTKNWAVEVKCLRSYSNVYDGIEQTLQYWDTYVQEETGTEYYTAENASTLERRKNDDEDDGDDVDAFLLATNNSRLGHIYDEWDDKDVRRSCYSAEREDEIEKGTLPGYEFSSTETSLRILLRMANYVLERNQSQPDRKPATGIGFLLSSALEQKSISEENAYKPKAQYYTLKKEGDANQHWESVS